MSKYRKHNELERKIFNLIREDDTNSFYANIVDGILIVLVLTSVVVAFLGTFDFSDEIMSVLNISETLFVLLFTAEYILRLWTSEIMYPKVSPLKARIKYMATPMAIIDLLSILPFYLPIIGVGVGTLKVLRLVRLLRVFKINRYTNSLSLIADVLKTRASQLISSIIVIFLLIFIASMIMYNIEHQAQPEVFDNALSATWWAMSTITTVGYGDIYPITTAGRMLSAIITFLGIGLTAIPTGILSAGFIEQSSTLRKQKNSDNSEMCYCLKCGQSLK